MITVMDTDITILIVFFVGYYIGRLQGSDRRLNRENVKLRKLTARKEQGSYNTQGTDLETN